MPANLTPQYLEAEAKFKQAKGVPEKIKALEVMMAVIPKHKGTEKLRGQLKSRMAKLKEELQRRPALGKTEFLYNVKRDGAGQVALLGLPNVGKSCLLSQITHAHSEVGDYPFTTQRPIPGMMEFENIRIQLVDTPPSSSNTSSLASLTWCAMRTLSFSFWISRKIRSSRQTFFSRS
jgi:ribosome-interacting GTPase 1